MISKTVTEEHGKITWKAKLADLALLTKMRLSLLVVVSAILGYLVAAPVFSFYKFAILVIGGFLVTGASNALNQIWERDADKVMKRTANRPLVTGRMSIREALTYSSLFGISGILLLWFGLNPLSGVLGALALVMYVFLYTPLKKAGPIAVFVGAFPGAIPPMLGYVAETGTFGMIPGILFAVQFIWQFPHFWAIAWKIQDDYSKAGYYMLPSRKRDKSSSLQILLYSLFLIPISLSPYWFGICGQFAAVLILLSGLGMAYYAARLHVTGDIKDATKVMFASFIYLPIVQIAYLISW